MVISTTQTSLQNLGSHISDWERIGGSYQGQRYIVDSGASLHLLGISSLTPKEKRTIRMSYVILDIQTANGMTVSELQAQIHIEELGIHFLG